VRGTLIALGGKDGRNTEAQRTQREAEVEGSGGGGKRRWREEEVEGRGGGGKRRQSVGQKQLIRLYWSSSVCCVRYQTFLILV
jgi:hypothetical protein